METVLPELEKVPYLVCVVEQFTKRNIIYLNNHDMLHYSVTNSYLTV